MSYYQSSSYPASSNNMQSTYPGGPGFPEPYPSSVAPASSYPGGPQASSYYQDHPGNTQYGASPNAPVAYDERGNPLPQGADGERGLGTMAMGAIGGVAANKMSGGHHSTMASGAGGAMLAQGAKMAFEMFNKKQGHGHGHGHGHGGHHGHHGHHGKHQSGPFGGAW